MKKKGNNDNARVSFYSSPIFWAAIGAATLVVAIVIRARRKPNYIKEQALAAIPLRHWSSMSLQTGDLLLIAKQTNTTVTKWMCTEGFVKAISKEPVNHVGVIIRDPNTQCVYVWDIVKSGFGRLVNINDYQQHYPISDIAVRRLQSSATTQNGNSIPDRVNISFVTAMRACKIQTETTQFDIDVCSRFMSRISYDKKNPITERPASTALLNKKNRVCSDLVAEWYQLTGCFATPVTFPCRALWPCDFVTLSPHYKLPWKPNIELSWPPEPLSLCYE